MQEKKYLPIKLQFHGRSIPYVYIRALGTGKGTMWEPLWEPLGNAWEPLGKGFGNHLGNNEDTLNHEQNEGKYPTKQAQKRDL